MKKLLKISVATIGIALLGGCIADNAEDSDLPWATSGSWEGLAPLAPSMINQYD